ncbi:MAG: hypothetical protein ACOH2A_00760 [Sphingobacteriaceae bacterium]
MIPEIRSAFNQQFTKNSYDVFLNSLEKDFPGLMRFRIAETPVFIDNQFAAKLINAGEDILKTILRPDFKSLTNAAIPQQWNVAAENDHPHFLSFDFAVCRDENGTLIPKLIELQGFPSLYAFQASLADHYSHAYHLPEHYDIYFNGLNKESYLQLLRKTIIGTHQPGEVVLMDFNAPGQKTMVDFMATQQLLQLPIISLKDLRQKGKNLFYHANKEEINVKRIYNRLIFDELDHHKDFLIDNVDIRQELAMEWMTHPNWFYRISKFLLPFLKGDYIPETFFLNEMETLPTELENYVLKPLFSFAGQGVVIHIKPGDLMAIKDPENWIIQRKVKYDPVITSPDGPVKCEIRLMYLWPDGDEKPTLVTNLTRLSRGEMIGVRYNQDFEWVGSTVAFMENH